MLSLSRYKTVTHKPTGIRLKLERLKREEARPLARALVKVFEEFSKLAKGEELTAYEKAAIKVEVFSNVSEEDIRRFSEHTSEIEGIAVDGQPITTGPDLVAVVDDDFLLWFLVELHLHSKLTDAEGKGSASLSRSPAATETSSGGSPAASIENEAGTEPSGVTVMTDPEPSSTPVEA